MLISGSVLCLNVLSYLILNFYVFRSKEMEQYLYFSKPHGFKVNPFSMQEKEFRIQKVCIFLPLMTSYGFNMTSVLDFLHCMSLNLKPFKFKELFAYIFLSWCENNIFSVYILFIFRCYFFGVSLGFIKFFFGVNVSLSTY